MSENTKMYADVILIQIIINIMAIERQSKNLTLDILKLVEK